MADAIAENLTLHFISCPSKHASRALKQEPGLETPEEGRSSQGPQKKYQAAPKLLTHGSRVEERVHIPRHCFIRPVIPIPAQDVRFTFQASHKEAGDASPVSDLSTPDKDEFVTPI